MALSIGKADNFRTRIPRHEQWSPALRLGATHAVVVEQEATRGRIEAELIAAYGEAASARFPYGAHMPHLGGLQPHAGPSNASGGSHDITSGA